MYILSKIIWRIGLPVVLCLYSQFATDAFAQSNITLAWDANIEADLAGYIIYYKAGSPATNKQDPNAVVEEVALSVLSDRNHPEYILPVDPSQIYFFAITAYDINSNESDLSSGACTLHITVPAEGFDVDNSNYSHFKIAGKGVPDTGIEIFVNNISLGTTTVDIDGGWAKHVDFTEVSSGSVSVTVVQNGVASYPVSGTYNLTPVNNAPTIVGTIPDQSKAADAAPWTLDLSTYESDAEDSDTALDWSVSGVNGALFGAVVTDSDNDLLTFSPVAGAQGSDVITLTLTDSGGRQATQDITVTLVSVQTADGDDDGMPDEWEVFSGLNPLVDDADADVDNDGYTNIEEYLYSTQPNDASSKPLPPTADAGPEEQKVDEGVTVTLDGSNSSDPNNDIVEYYWQQTGGEPDVLPNRYSNAVQPTFVAPQVASGGEAFTFQLTVTDRSGQQHTDTCIVTVTWDNDPPTAHAGEDQPVGQGVTVTLDGSGSTDSDDGIQSYLWTQTDGVAVTLSDTAADKPTFVSPTVESNGAPLEFRLFVIDNGNLQSTDTCVVNVTWDNDPPAADAGPDQTVAVGNPVQEGETVTLDGSASSDSDDGVQSYLWTQRVGIPVTLSNAAAIQPTFVTPAVDSNGGHLEFELRVTDNGGLVHTDIVAVEVVDNGILGYSDDVLTKTVAGGEIGLKVEPGGNLVNLTTMDPESLADTTNMPDDLIYGLLDMVLKPDLAGGTVKLKVYLDEPAPEGYRWYKYDTGTNIWTDFSEATDANGNIGAVFNAARNEVIITLVDGGLGDDDGDANGIILDPSGLGSTLYHYSLSNETGNSESGGSGGGGCFVATAGVDAVFPLWLLLVCWIVFICIIEEKKRRLAFGRSNRGWNGDGLKKD
jgi:hypothetical protein